MLDWLCEAWGKFTRDDIKKSFICCGQSLDGGPEQIACLKEGRTQHSIYPKVVDVWNQMNEEEIGPFEDTPDLQEDIINEMVIEDVHEEEDFEEEEEYL